MASGMQRISACPDPHVGRRKVPPGCRKFTLFSIDIFLQKAPAASV
jgi:hypothetical protein